jgi:DNA-binding winged helix-turn-helix (wHTH) protein
MMEIPAFKNFSFGDFELDVAKRLLFRQGTPVSLNAKTFDLLLVLVEHHGQILSKKELLEKVWVGQIVEESNLAVQVSTLRKIFGEKKDEHQFIVTVPGNGYSFVARLRQSQSSETVIDEKLKKESLETTNGLGSEETAQSFDQQLPTKLNEELQARKNRIERLGTAALGAFCFGVLIFFLYAIVYRIMILQGSILVGLGLFAFFALIACGPLSMYLFAKANEIKEAKQPAAGNIKSRRAKFVVLLLFAVTIAIGIGFLIFNS